MAKFPDHPFWNFSLEVYMSHGVGPACLELQTRHQLDVNILLYCMWAGASGRGALTGSQMASVDAAVKEWHQDVVRALRAVRVRMKTGVGNAPDDLTEALRQRIQKIEIDCEHVEQLILANTVDLAANGAKTNTERLEDAVSNISSYFATFGEVSGADRRSLALILKVAFRDLEADQVEAAAGAM
ncbi:MAG: TIGR02444 family protein [Pseudomonadota bacterium]|nr:TIGR02444 family protein [Pseudomonadota bacterium]